MKEAHFYIPPSQMYFSASLNISGEKVGLFTKYFPSNLIEGKRHDARMLTMSGLLTQLEQHSHAPDGSPLCIYGDPAYPLRAHLQSPYKNNNQTDAQKAFNTSMSRVRVSVEWIFGDIIGHWKFLDFKKDLKLGLSAVGKQYAVAALLRNALTCFYGSTTTNYFYLETPTIEQYFQT